MAKYFANVGGKFKEVLAITTSAGAGDSGKIIGLDGTGRIDPSFMPVGTAAETLTATATEALNAGDFVNVYSGATGISCRKADASVNSKPADGFVLAAVSSSATATIHQISQKNTQLSSLTIGAEYWLSTTPGAVTTIPPSGSGQIVQLLGKADSLTSLVFADRTYFELS